MEDFMRKLELLFLGSEENEGIRDVVAEGVALAFMADAPSAREMHILSPGAIAF